jgi:MscS family membrane protein
MQDILNQTLMADNEIWRIVTLFGIILIAVVAAKLGRSALMRSADMFERHSRLLSAAALRALARSLVLLSIAIAFPLGAAFLTLGELAMSIVQTLRGVLVSVAVGYTLFQLVDVVTMWLQRFSVQNDDSMQAMLVPIVRTSLRVTVVALSTLQVVQSLTDKPLTSIIAGLGVGGLAVALAAQDTIKHFFGSLVLFADKPFMVGDRISVDAVDGVVELVGFRSTRIRTLEGALVSFPNGDLANKTIVNLGCRPYIRHRSFISITYDTPPEKLARATDIIKNLLANHEGMDPGFPPRVIFDEFASASLNILIMYWYHPANYWAYKLFNEQLFYKILEQLNAEGVNFAFPTQTVYIAGDSRKPVQSSPPLDQGSSGTVA